MQWRKLFILLLDNSDFDRGWCPAANSFPVVSCDARNDGKEAYFPSSSAFPNHDSDWEESA